MAEIAIVDDTLIVHVTGWDRLWALKRRLEIPMAHVLGATRDPETARKPIGLRAPGTYLPRLITAGTWRRRVGNVFWDVHDPERVIVIDLADEPYATLVVEVADPAATVAAIEAARA